jgi:hypothetical protein
MNIYLVRGAGWAVSLLLAVSLAACIDSDDGGGEGNDGGNGVPEGPLDRDDGDGDGDEAPRSPLDIPEITESQGLPIDQVRPRLEADLAEQCGGELCVEIREEPGDNDNYTRCEFDTTDPPPGGQVERGGTVIIVTGPLPCDSPSPPPASPPPPAPDPLPTSTP